jgi:hypothetical protein
MTDQQAKFFGALVLARGTGTLPPAKAVERALKVWAELEKQAPAPQRSAGDD